MEEVASTIKRIFCHLVAINPQNSVSLFEGWITYNAILDNIKKVL
jgi:hypothetical protein